METWKTVSNTDGKIQVSNYGRVRSLLRGEPQILKVQADQKGYQRVSVTIHRRKMHFKVHRLVAAAFIENPNNLPQVNHIDGNKGNNCVSNLEWISNKDNAYHAIKNGLWDNCFDASKRHNDAIKKPVIAYRGTEKKRFESISEAERYFDSRHICDVLKGKRDHVKGWSFCYESEVM